VVVEVALGERLFDWLRSRQSLPWQEFLDVVVQKPIILVAPHLDDGVWSCGGTLAHLARRGARILLVSVFTADLPEGTNPSPLAQQLAQDWGGGREPFGMRRREDEAVARRLGVECRWLGFPDCIYRYPEMSMAEIELKGFQSRRDPVFEAVRAALLRTVEAYPGATVFGPLGLGHHRDHLLVYEAIQDIALIVTTSRYYFYEDFPYAMEAGLQERLAALGWRADPQTVDIRDTLDERLHLMTMYSSQVAPFLGSRESAHQQVVAYATRVGSRMRPRERFWWARGDGRR
jgi:LmbE family N-acetylglucosaminyl deacetylase